MSLDAYDGMSRETADVVLTVFAAGFELRDGDIYDRGGRTASERTLAIVAQAQAVLDGLT
jgi:hypothetical protein